MKFTCPHCGERTFSPLKKALCGGMTSGGGHCPSCGGRCVNGKVSLVVQYILSIAAFAMVLYTYFTYRTASDILWGGVIPLASALVLRFLFDMFFGKLIPALKRE